eukprot:GHVS01024590.1.p1 GENE.GHVS01024590.1~~GHVS01024590.1.p1  ORF type:complete len:190 (-),score=26.99 GHVS01024590.1:148-717(-)
MGQVIDDKIKAAEPPCCSNPPLVSEAGDESLSKWREKRIAELKERKREEGRHADGCGTFDELTEGEFLAAVTKSKLAVCHFFQDEFERCQIVDKHLRILAPLHTTTRFIKLNAEKCALFASKLKIRILPTIVLFIDGVAVHSVVGFTEFGGTDGFSSRSVEVVLKKHKVILSLKIPKSTDQSDVSSDDS